MPAFHIDGIDAPVWLCGTPAKPCVSCRRIALSLCDYKISRGRTCDAPICDQCTTKLPGNKDACPKHRDVCLEACRRLGLEIPA